MYNAHFFPLKKLRKLRCVLYMESFVSDSRPSLACKQIHDHLLLIEKLKTEPSKEFEVRYRQCGGLGRCSGLLVDDTFESHVTENVKVQTVVFAKENTNLALILRRLTSVV